MRRARSFLVLYLKCLKRKKTEIKSGNIERNRVMDNNFQNAHFAGAGTVAGGNYNEVKCSGSVKITGDIKCKRFSCSGAAKAVGNIDCEGAVKTAGAFSSEGDVSAEIFEAAGAVKIAKSLNAKKIDAAGAIKILGEASAEKAEIHGSVAVEGLFNADELCLVLDHNSSSDSRISTFGGSYIKVSARRSGWRLFRRSYSLLKAGLIEADRVELENTHADTVRTIDAFIGDGCKIGTLEYSGEAKISENAQIENIVKM